MIGWSFRVCLGAEELEQRYGDATRASRSPHFRLCSPEIRKKLRLFCRLQMIPQLNACPPSRSVGKRTNMPLNVQVFGQRLLVNAGQKMPADASAVRDVLQRFWTQKDCKFILGTGHSRHRSSNLSWLRQVSEFTPVTPNIALITRFSTPTSRRSHAGTLQNFKTHAEDLRRNLN